MRSFIPVPELVPAATYRAGRGLVCSIDHLASTAGLHVLRSGGTAADAAVATSAVLAVTSPHVCGAGGDLLAVVVPPVHAPGGPVALNASGRAGSGADADQLRSEGHRTMPFRHDIRSVTVPGCVDGWIALHQRFGRLPLSDVLAPARGYAEHGFPAGPTLCEAVVGVWDLPEAADLVPPGRSAGDPGPLPAGTWLRRPGMARALAAVAEGGRAAFYEGEFGRELIELGHGHFTPADLARSQADWVEPLVAEAWGGRLWTVPPNSQGYLTLAAAAMAAGLDLPGDPADPLWAHLLVEAARQAGRDRPAFLHERADGASVLAPEELDRRRAAIDRRRAAPLAGSYGAGDTIGLCVVDEERMGVSLLQSNASGFGSHLVLPGLRIFLHDRGIGFSLQPGHPAEYGPGRRPPHTLSPLALTGPGGHLRAVAASMGGDAQPQILLQLVARWLHAGQDPGTATAAGRWALSGGSSGFDTWTGAQPRVLVEGHAPASWEPGLAALGHRVERTPAFSHGFGHAHLITVEEGRLAAGTDPRPRNGSAAGF